MNRLKNQVFEEKRPLQAAPASQECVVQNQTTTFPTKSPLTPCRHLLAHSSDINMLKISEE